MGGGRGRQGGREAGGERWRRTGFLPPPPPVPTSWPPGAGAPPPPLPCCDPSVSCSGGEVDSMEAAQSGSCPWVGGGVGGWCVCVCLKGGREGPVKAALSAIATGVLSPCRRQKGASARGAARVAALPAGVAGGRRRGALAPTGTGRPRPPPSPQQPRPHPQHLAALALVNVHRGLRPRPRPRRRGAGIGAGACAPCSRRFWAGKGGRRPCPLSPPLPLPPFNSRQSNSGLQSVQPSQPVTHPWEGRRGPAGCRAQCLPRTRRPGSAGRPRQTQTQRHPLRRAAGGGRCGGGAVARRLPRTAHASANLGAGLGTWSPLPQPSPIASRSTLPAAVDSGPGTQGAAALCACDGGGREEGGGGRQAGLEGRSTPPAAHRCWRA